MNSNAYKVLCIAILFGGILLSGCSSPEQTDATIPQETNESPTGEQRNETDTTTNQDTTQPENVSDPVNDTYLDPDDEVEIGSLV